LNFTETEVQETPEFNPVKAHYSHTLRCVKNDATELQLNIHYEMTNFNHT